MLIKTVRFSRQKDTIRSLKYENRTPCPVDFSGLEHVSLAFPSGLTNRIYTFRSDDGKRSYDLSDVSLHTFSASSQRWFTVIDADY